MSRKWAELGKLKFSTTPNYTPFYPWFKNLSRLNFKSQLRWVDSWKTNQLTHTPFNLPNTIFTCSFWVLSALSPWDFPCLNIWNPLPADPIPPSVGIWTWNTFRSYNSPFFRGMILMLGCAAVGWVTSGSWWWLFAMLSGQQTRGGVLLYQRNLGFTQKQGDSQKIRCYPSLSRYAGSPV